MLGSSCSREYAFCDAILRMYPLAVNTWLLAPVWMLGGSCARLECGRARDASTSAQNYHRLYLVAMCAAPDQQKIFYPNATGI